MKPTLFFISFLFLNIYDITCAQFLVSKEEHLIWGSGPEDNGKQILYHYFPESQNLKAKFVLVNNQILLREFYFYNNAGQVNQICCDDGSSEDIEDLSNVTERYIKKIAYSTKYPAFGMPEIIEEACLDLSSQKEIILRKIINRYNATTKNIQQDIYDADHHYQYSIYNTYDEQHQLIVSSNSPGNIIKNKQLNKAINSQSLSSLTSNNSMFDSYSLYSFDSFWPIFFAKAELVEEKFSKFFHSIKDFINDYLSLEFNLKNKIEDAALAFFGRNTLLLHGFYLDNHEVGTFGDGELNDKVRITLINGILNARLDIMESAEMISKFHGGNNIHYIFRPTEGWSYDFIKCSLVKFGWISPEAEQLVVRWKELIAEMGGINQGGKIIHYAHSIGAADTLVAKKFLSSEELQMIQVYTFGSPCLLRPDGFHSVTNYISKGDGVSYLDPVSYVQSMINPIEHISFIPSSWPLPFIDHQLTFPAYKSILETLGKQFLEKYVE